MSRYIYIHILKNDVHMACDLDPITHDASGSYTHVHGLHGFHNVNVHNLLKNRKWGLQNNGVYAENGETIM